MVYAVCNFKQLIGPRSSLIQPELQRLVNYWVPFQRQEVPAVVAIADKPLALQ